MWAFNNIMPRFEVTNYEPDNIPHIITVSPILDLEHGETIEDLELATLVSGVVIDSVYRRVHRYLGWSKAKCLSRVSGILSATNYSNNKTFDIFGHLIEVRPQKIFEIMQAVVQSSDTVEIYELDWSFTIDVNSLINGAGGDFPIPSWVGSVRNRPTWKEQKFEETVVNCAAFAITWYLKNRPYRYINATIQEAYRLQLQLGWNSTVDYDDMKKFVMYYPDYKLNIITPPNQKPTHTYVGNSYIYNHKKNIIFLYYYQNHRYNAKHYALCESPITKLNSGNYSWCYFCDLKFSVGKGHTCEQTCRAPSKKPDYKFCEHCHLYESSYHLCFHFKCKVCQSYSKTGAVHRCPLMFKEPKAPEDKAFIVYDLESRFEIVESVRRVVTNFEMTEDGYYLEGPSVDVAIYGHTQNKHVANLVCAKDMFTNQTWTFFGENCLEEFLGFCFSYNNGNNVLLAHNASGYDSRLIFDASRIFVDESKFTAIMRGSKFMQMTIGTLVFRDIMLQIPGSVKSLAKDFGCQHQKGDFPFMFNTLENYDYNGPIPPLKYFSLGNAKNDKQRQDLIEWHTSWTGPWNFKEQLVSYCHNDVEVSCEIAKAYHDIWVEKGIYPWLKPTGAGVVHQYMGLQAFNQLCLENDPPDVSDKEEYAVWLQRMTHEKWWAVLKPYEHFFAHKALRGGRTEVKRPYFKLSDEDYAAGKRILYVDVCSMYPYQQIVHDFPVGTPIVNVWTKKYMPCKIHLNSINCEVCPSVVRQDSSISTIFHHLQPSLDNVRTWFGIVCVTLVPPKKMFHPVLVSYSEDLQKCVATLNVEDHIEIFIGTSSLHACLASGYKLEKVHCYHAYSKGNFWRDPTLKLYLDKMMNSKNAPESVHEKEAFVKKWSDIFGDEFGVLIRESWPKWGKLNAKKFVAKIIINSVWGKHAQRVIMPKTYIYDFKTELPEIQTYFKNCVDGDRIHKNSQPLSDTKIMYTALDPKAPPDLHNQYLPAGLMVPEYGRLQLWEQLNLLGDRVLYCDTDSIMYVSVPGMYDVPIGDMVGDWEIEDICTEHEGIREFVAWGPKSYGLKCGDGYTTVKAKGVSLKRATEAIFNFDVMKRGALEFLANGKMTSSFIPQINFTWGIDKGMRTIYNLKELSIKEKELKGLLHEGFMYPFGYCFD